MPNSSINPQDSFYSPLTQVVANNFPKWTEIRQDITSSGQQFLNSFGGSLNEVTRNTYAAVSGIYLGTADINQADIIYKVQFPRTSPIAAASIPNCVGDSIYLPQIDNLDDFLYRVVPTRLLNVDIGTGIPMTLTFDDQLKYDIPFTDSDRTESPIYFQYNQVDQKLDKFYIVDVLPDVQPAVVPNRNIINSYTLKDINGADIAGTYKGACLYLDRALILIDLKLYVFDIRAKLIPNTDPTWVGNTDLPYIQAIKEVDMGVFATNISGLVTDYDSRFFWVNINGMPFKFRLLFDYVIFDEVNQTFFFREEYSSLTIGGTPHIKEFHHLWNWFDEFGLELDQPRLTGEKNADYKDRLFDVFEFRANSATQGYINGTTRELGLDYWGYYPSGYYPTNIFADGNVPSGTPIYVSGVYPSGVQDIAKINSLYDPVFYSGVVDPTTNIPSATFVDYTQEIMQTFPIVWGSGTPDPYGFIWDLSPFDGGLNNAQIVPDYFALVPSGIDPKWFQSGVRDPNPQLEDVVIRFYRDADDRWIPQAHEGDFFIHNRSYHLFTLAGFETIPSGTLDYTIIGSGSIIPTAPIVVFDVSGIVSSGIEFIGVNSFDGGPYEYIYSGGHIFFDQPHSNLNLYYETSPSGWHTIPGWDFNPTHAAVDNGFIWISDREQVIDISGSYNLNVTPDSISFKSGGSTLIGQLLDTVGDPVVGATAFFEIANSGVGSITNPFGITSLDGRAYSFYNPPADAQSILISGTLVASGTIVIDTAVKTIDPEDIWTAYQTPDPVVSGLTDTFVYMVQNNSYTLTISPGDWLTATGGFYGGAFDGQFVIGGLSIDNFNGAIPVGDDFFNIKLDTLTYDFGSGPSINITDITNSSTPGAPFMAFEADAFATPQVYGKIILYAVTIPVGTVYVHFDTFKPLKPTQVLPNIPSSGQTTLLYIGEPLPSGLDYLIGYPQSVDIESWAEYNGVETLHVFKTINMDFSNAQTGVFQVAGDGIGGKFLDFLSYLRIS